MPLFRVEISTNNRAGCRNKACKDNNVKILKGEVRIGPWVELPAGGHGDGSFHWKHWGCISGAQLLHIRENLKQGNEDGDYQWEFFDGLDEMPDWFQEKFKTAITEGKIADEDWKGDPECNVLGQRGTHLKVKKAKEVPENGDANTEKAETPATKKRSRANKIEETEDEATPAKKRRATKAKKDSGDEEAKPAKKVRANKAAKKEDNVAAKDEEESHDKAVPIKQARGQKQGVKKEAKVAVKNESKSDDEVVPVKKARGKKAVKEEDTVIVKDEARNTVNLDVKPTKKPTTKTKKGVKKEESEDESIAKVEEDHDVSIDVHPAKSSRAMRASKRNSSS